MLKPVVIKEKKIIKDSKNLNGPGEADLIIDEKDLAKVTHLTMYQLLMKMFGRDFYRVVRGEVVEYHLFLQKVNLVIDGLYINDWGLSTDTYMEMFSAEDIKGIEIMRNPKYALAYDPDFTGKLIMLKQTEVPIYLEVTTYSGHGAFTKNVAGVYLYRTLPFTLPKTFYRPRYTVKNSNTAMGTDLRSTLHWAPQVVTDKDGKATVSFFTADKRADYTLIMEGIDMNGNLGYKRQQIKGVSKTASK